MPPSMVITDRRAPCDATPALMGHAGPAVLDAGGGTFRQRIRSETRRAHDLVDDEMSMFDLRDAGSYARFLARHGHALSILQSQVRSEDQSDIQAMADAVEADLGILGLQNAPVAFGPERLDGFGVAYVIRGSRMGARVLRGCIGLGLPTQYMDFTPTLGWREFLAALEAYAAEGGEAVQGKIVHAARRAFEAFSPAHDRPS